jgi:hypothetical protein
VQLPVGGRWRPVFRGHQVPANVPGTSPGHAGAGTPLLPAQGDELAAFAEGCFWGSEDTFRHVAGVVATAVGYSGGHTTKPSYEDVCSHTTGHAETVLVEYDPKKVTYAQLLRTFWDSHDPTTPQPAGARYRRPIPKRNLHLLEGPRRGRSRVAGGGASALPRQDHDADRAHRAILEGRGLPPAIRREDGAPLVPPPRPSQGFMSAGLRYRPRAVHRQPLRRRWTTGAHENARCSRETHPARPML